MSSLSGMTKQPFSLDRDPGGSSSGTGTAISASFGTPGLGEDTGGSIRLPSSYGGLVGLRPISGLISRNGMWPLITTDTPGPMTQTVWDAALTLDALAGFDESDPWTAAAVIVGDPVGGSYAAELESHQDLISKSRVGVLRIAIGDDSDPDCKAVKKVIDGAFQTLGKSGMEFVDMEIPNMEQTLAFTPTYLSRSRSDIDGYLATTKPPLNTSCGKIHAAKKFHEKLELFANFCTGPATPSEDPYYLQRLEDWDAFQMLVIGIMAKHNISAIAFPDAKVPAPLRSDVGRWGPMEFSTNTLLGSVLRMPAIPAPAVFTEHGLPVGLEILGLPHAEQTLLEMAHGVERFDSC